MAYKICSQCNEEAGVRTKICICGAVFPSKSKREKALRPKTEDVSWDTLNKGDKIKVICGYGPYHESKDKNGQLKRVYTGCKPGEYLVESLEKEGLFVTDGYHRNFVYMSESKQGIVGWKEAHKVKLIKRFVEEKPVGN
jgi:hypothetical protein